VRYRAALTLILSASERDLVYQKYLAISPIILYGLVRLGARLMQKSGVHRHFFGKNTFWHNFMGTSCLLPTAQHLALHALNLPKDDYKRYSNKCLTRDEALRIIQIFEKRISERMPTEYITNQARYLSRDFYVNKHVLVPRSLMSARFEDFLQATEWHNYKVLDLCCGSGCIGISLAFLNPNIEVHLSDVSDDALKVAQCNIDRFSLNSRVKCIQGDLFEGISERYDLIISNPPYVAQHEYQASSCELKNEPKIALECGIDGLDIVRRIVQKSAKYLNEKGQLIVEVGFSAPKILKKEFPGMLKWLPPKPFPGEADLIDFIPGIRHCIFVAHAKNLEAFEIR
jgi:ribosomal protein L3 glutamine methyltransferase